MPLLEAWTALEARLARFSRARFILTTALVALGVSVTVFAPRLQLWNLSRPDHFETSRARAFLAQCENPWRRDVEPAMHWRLLPPIVCHGLGLRGRAALVVPWLGVLALASACAGVLEGTCGSRGRALLGTIMIATSSAFLVPTGWLGMNDAWAWLGLLAVANAGGIRWVALAGLLAPWVDERFVLGLPLALWVRRLNRPGDPTWRAAIWILPYLVVRLIFQAGSEGAVTNAFATSILKDSVAWLPFAPLGWWMAWRAGWIPLLVAGRTLQASAAGVAWTGLGLAAVTLGFSAVFASDLSRSAAVLLPAFVWAWQRWAPGVSIRLAGGLVAGQLALPAMHVVHAKTALISPLPVELFRLARNLLQGRAPL